MSRCGTAFTCEQHLTGNKWERLMEVPAAGSQSSRHSSAPFQEPLHTHKRLTRNTKERVTLQEWSAGQRGGAPRAMRPLHGIPELVLANRRHRGGGSTALGGGGGSSGGGSTAGRSCNNARLGQPGPWRFSCGQRRRKRWQILGPSRPWAAHPPPSGGSWPASQATRCTQLQVKYITIAGGHVAFLQSGGRGATATFAGRACMMRA